MEKYRKFSLFIILIPTPDFPHFYYMLGGNLGSLLHGDVSVMNSFSGLMISAEENRDVFSAINYSLVCGFCSERSFFVLVLGIGCRI